MVELRAEVPLALVVVLGIQKMLWQARLEIFYRHAFGAQGNAGSLLLLSKEENTEFRIIILGLRCKF